MDFRVQMAKDVGKTVAEAVAKCADPVMEPKYDGWRCVVIRDESGVRVFKPSRNSDPSKEYTGQLPELEADLMNLPVGAILDGELVALTYDTETLAWTNDFFRIHTVMRSNSTVPAQREGIKLIAFDIVAASANQTDVWREDLDRRRAHIERVIADCSMVELTLQMTATQENHDTLVAAGFEGTVIKDRTKPYAFAKRGHGWFKVKWITTIDCVVMEVLMDGKGQHAGKAGRMRVGQYKGGVLIERCVVNCLDNAQRDEATAHPERFVGRVIEVKVYGWHKDGTPRHPTPLRFRDGDKEPSECIWSDT